MNMMATEEPLRYTNKNVFATFPHKRPAKQKHVDEGSGFMDDTMSWSIKQSEPGTVYGDQSLSYTPGGSAARHSPPHT